MACKKELNWRGPWFQNLIFFYWMSDQFGYDVREVAYILVAMAVVMASIQGGGIRPLVKHLGERRMLVAGLLLMAAAFPVIPGIHAVGLLLLPLALSAVGRAIAQPPMTSMISMRGEASGRGELMGVFQSSAALCEEGSSSPVVGRAYPDRVLWGDTHVHTSMSPGDANLLGGNDQPPTVAYRIARGERVHARNGMPLQLRRPLDFLVIADLSLIHI